MTTPAHASPAPGNKAAGSSFWERMRGVALALAGAALLVPFFVCESENFSNFSVIFSSIMLEAMPFMLLGTLIGGLIEVFVSRERMETLLPRGDLRSACVAAAMGILFPVCECAIVPVVRRLVGKGLSASAAIAYLLGGPIVNPVVGLSTAMAYGFVWQPVAFRLGFGYAIAVLVSLCLVWTLRRESLFIDGVAALEVRNDTHGHGHGHGGCSCACGCGHAHADSGTEHADGHGRHDGETAACGCGGHHAAGSGIGGRLASAANHGLDDFMATAPYLVAGAFIAALAQTYVERRMFVGLASSPIMSSGVMMLLAILLNVCSEADAFIAASFRGLVPFSAQMAFLVIGPMFDIKLLLMLRTLFRTRAVALLAAFVVVAVLLMAVIIDMMGVAQ